MADVTPQGALMNRMESRDVSSHREHTLFPTCTLRGTSLGSQCVHAAYVTHGVEENTHQTSETWGEGNNLLLGTELLEQDTIWNKEMQAPVDTD